MENNYLPIVLQVEPNHRRVADAAAICSYTIILVGSRVCMPAASGVEPKKAPSINVGFFFFACVSVVVVVVIFVFLFDLRVKPPTKFMVGEQMLWQIGRNGRPAVAHWGPRVCSVCICTYVWNDVVLSLVLAITLAIAAG